MHMRQYNALFLFALLGVKLDHSVNGGGLLVFKINRWLSLIAITPFSPTVAAIPSMHDLIFTILILILYCSNGQKTTLKKYRLNLYVRMYKGYEQSQHDIPDLHM